MGWKRSSSLSTLECGANHWSGCRVDVLQVFLHLITMICAELVHKSYGGVHLRLTDDLDGQTRPIAFDLLPCLIDSNSLLALWWVLGVLSPQTLNQDFETVLAVLQVSFDFIGAPALPTSMSNKNVSKRQSPQD